MEENPFPIPADVPRTPSGEVDVTMLRRTNPARLDELLRQVKDWKKTQKRPPGRPRKAAPTTPAPKRPRGRPRKDAVAQEMQSPAERDPVRPAETKPERKEEETESLTSSPAVEDGAPAGAPPAAAVIEMPRPEPEPFKIQPPPDADIEPVKPAKPAPRQPEPPTLEVALPADLERIQMADEYGELDRQMQLRSTGVARYETLKRAIKSWFDDVPADADGIVEGEMYLLRVSARERERKIRDMRALVDEIGLDKVLDLATVALGVLEDLIGKTRVQALTVETRAGSRRIKAVPKHPALNKNGGPVSQAAV